MQIWLKKQEDSYSLKFRVCLPNIRTEWTKISRGAPNATKRNAVPEVFPVSGMDTLEAGIPILLQTLYFNEWANFMNPKVTIEKPELKEENQFGWVIITRLENQVQVKIYKLTDPHRIEKPENLFILDNNEWSKLAFNERVVGNWDGDWFYRKIVFNIGNFTHFNSNIFLSQPPLYNCNRMKHLY